MCDVYSNDAPQPTKRSREKPTPTAKPEKVAHHGAELRCHQEPTQHTARQQISTGKIITTMTREEIQLPVQHRKAATSRAYIRIYPGLTRHDVAQAIRADVPS